MFSKNYKKHKKYSPTGFRYRGIKGSRLEYLTDAVFAFAITLLVIASEVPTTYIELQVSMYGFLGFIACVMLLLGLWSNHSKFFLRYGMVDNQTKTLNFLFLFVLLFYIYPLKYLFSFLGAFILIRFVGVDSSSSDALILAYEKAQSAQLDVDQWVDLMVRFGLGLFLIYFILVGMHVNALVKKKQLELNELEIFETKFHLINFVFLCTVCVTSISYVLITGGGGSGESGMIYIIIPIGLIILGKINKVRFKKKFPNYAKFSYETPKEPAWSEKKAEELVGKVLSGLLKRDNQEIKENRFKLIEKEEEIKKLKIEIQKNANNE